MIEVRQYEVTCPECGKVHVEEPPSGLEMHRTFGGRLEATVVYYRQEQHMSYQRTQQALLNLHGVQISQGGIDGIMQRAGEQAIQAAKTIENAVRQSAVIHSDETSSRVNGDNWWEWVFCTTQAVLHVIRFNRSEDVIKDLMRTFKAEVWESDCYAAQLKAPAGNNCSFVWHINCETCKPWWMRIHALPGPGPCSTFSTCDPSTSPTQPNVA